MNKPKLFKLDSNENEIIIKNNKLLTSKIISLKEPSDDEFENTWSWILDSASNFNDYENFEINEVEITDFDIKKGSSAPMHRELLISFKNMFETELKNIFFKIKDLKQK